MINWKAPARGAPRLSLSGRQLEASTTISGIANCPALNKTSHCSPLSYQPSNPRVLVALAPGQARYLVRHPCRVLGPTSSNPTRCRSIIPCTPLPATTSSAPHRPNNHPYDTVTKREAPRPRATTFSLVTTHDEGIQTARGRQSPPSHIQQPSPRHTMANQLSMSSSREPRTATRSQRKPARTSHPAPLLLTAPEPSRPPAPPRPRPRISQRPANHPAMPRHPLSSSPPCRNTNTSSKTRVLTALKAPIATSRA
jgi:hypothetical protein